MQKRQNSTRATLLMTVRIGSNVCVLLCSETFPRPPTPRTSTASWTPPSPTSNHQLILWSCSSATASLPFTLHCFRIQMKVLIFVECIFFFLLDDEQGSCCIPECDVFTSKDFWRHLYVWKLLTLLYRSRLIEMTRMSYNLLPLLFFRKKWIEFLSESMQSRVTGQKYYRYFALCLWNILQRIVMLSTCYHQNVFYVCIYVYIFESVHFPHILHSFTSCQLKPANLWEGITYGCWRTFLI